MTRGVWEVDVELIDDWLKAVDEGTWDVLVAPGRGRPVARAISAASLSSVMDCWASSCPRPRPASKSYSASRTLTGSNGPATADDAKPD